MKKKLIVAAIAAAVVAPTLAMADATVYGKVRVATQYHDRSQNVFRDADGELRFGPEDSWGMQDQTSRLGIKGSEDLGNGLKAIYKMEFGVNVGDGWGKSSFWSQRNSYIGLAGGWGTFLAGRHDTPFKMSSGKLDFFADSAADYDTGGKVGIPTAKGVGLFNSIRADGVMAYISPNWAGFTVSAALIQTDTSGFDARFDNVPNTDADDFVSAYSIAGQYNNGPWFASLAYEDLDGESLGESLNGPFTDNYTKWRAGLGILGWAGFSGAFIYEDRSNQDFRDGNDSSSWQIQGAYDFGNNRVKAMYGSYDSDDFADFHDADTWAIGYQYNFSSRTDVQVIYRDYDGDEDDLSLIGDDSVFAVQLDHSF